MVASLEKSPLSGKALSLPLGVVSPLWMMFAGAATAGVAYWWMTRWTRPTNLEAELPAAKPEVQDLIEAGPAVVEEVLVEAPVAEVVEQVEAAAETAIAPNEPPLKLRKRTPKAADAS